MSSSMHLTRARTWFLQFPPIEWAAAQLRELLMASLRQGPIPQHVAFVMDGNRRFARSRQIETAEGHNQGFEALARILEVCYKTGVRVVTVYAFSVENFSRSRREVEGLMALAKLKLTQLAAHGELLARYGARIRILGQRDMIRADVLAVVEEVEAMTAHNGDAVLNVCFPYTSRDEMTGAVREIVDKWSRPTAGPRKSSAFSETHIVQAIRSRHLTSAAERVVARSRGSSPQPPTTTAEGRTEGAEGREGNADKTEGAELKGDTHSEKREPNPDSHPASDAEPDISSAASLSSSTTLHAASSAPTTATTTPTTATTETYNDAHTYPDVDDITEATLTQHMLTAGMPPLDLLVRTSGVERFSDFLLWQAHDGADVAFSKCYWPEFDLWHFFPVLLEWQWRRRREVREGRVKVKVV